MLVSYLPGAGNEVSGICKRGHTVEFVTAPIVREVEEHR